LPWRGETIESNPESVFGRQREAWKNAVAPLPSCLAWQERQAGLQNRIAMHPDRRSPSTDLTDGSRSGGGVGCEGQQRKGGKAH